MQLVTKYDLRRHTSATALVWCDGYIRGGLPHERVEYAQPLVLLGKGGNWCPKCGAPPKQQKPSRLTRSDVKHRVVNPADAMAPIHDRVLIWCDGSVQGNTEHRRREYLQSLEGLISGRNGCPDCVIYKGPPSPGLQYHPRVQQMVNPRLAASTKQRDDVLLWCDGVVQGKSKHRRVEYLQSASSFTKQRNGCPICGGPGPQPKGMNGHPRAVQLVNPEDAILGVRASVRVWCEGAQYGKPKHDRVMYLQQIMRLKEGINGCPQCGKSKAARRTDHLHQSVVQVSPDTPPTTVLRVWCDGSCYGNPRHERVEYLQRLEFLKRGINACPVCGDGERGQQWAARRR